MISKLKISPISSFPHTAQEWVWPRWVPAGEITMLDGDPGCGKSTLSLYLAACVSTGRMPLSASPTREPATAIMFQAEDAVHVTQQRLEAQGADLDRVCVVDLRELGSSKLLLPNDIEVLEEVIRDCKAKFVCLDPAQSFFSCPLTSGHPTRLALDQLSVVAKRTGAAIVLVRHFTKAGGRTAMYWGAGSNALSGTARSVLLVVRHPVDEKLRILAQAKTNVGEEATSLVWEICKRGEGVAIKWRGESALTAEKLLGGGHKQTNVKRAAELLCELLRDGSRAAKEIFKIGKQEGFCINTMKAAKELVGVHSERVGFGRGGYFLWVLPEKSEVVDLLQREHVEEVLDEFYSTDLLDRDVDDDAPQESGADSDSLEPSEDDDLADEDDGAPGLQA